MDFPPSASPSWSADGKWLRYTTSALELTQDLKKTTYAERNIETGEERLARQRRASVSPRPWLYSESEDGGWAVYAGENGRKIQREFFTSGTTETLLETSEPISGLEAFRDGREILFSTHSAGRDIHRIKALRISDRSIRQMGVSRQPPQFAKSPNDREVYVSDLNCLVVLPRYGAEAQTLTCTSPARLPTPGKYPGQLVYYTWWGDQSASWSPDGTKIAWTVAVEEKRRVELWIVDRLTGTHQVGWAGLDDYYTMPRQPAWSPDGRYIAFAIQIYHDNEVWALRGLM